MIVTLLLAAATIALYFYAVHRYNARFPDRVLSAWNGVSFATGCLLMTAVLLPPLDTLADSSFGWHMAQHVTLMLIGPPLLLLGAPMLLLVAVPPPRVARRITAFAQSKFGDALFAPLTGWLLFVFVLWMSHFSPLYEASLEHEWIHVLEHLLYIGSALLFWSAVVQVGYTPRPMPYAFRMAYLFLAIPQGAFLGFALYATHHILYRHYLIDRTLGAALEDQHNGGAVMWIAGGLLLFTAFMCCGAKWAASERPDVPVRLG